MINLPS